MPKGDRTGPSGLGPTTGRAAGYCTGYPVPGFMNPTCGFRRGLSRGLGRGWRRGFGRGWRTYTPIAITPEQEVAALENYQKELETEKADLEQEMNQIKSRIKETKAKLEK